MRKRVLIKNLFKSFGEGTKKEIILDDLNLEIFSDEITVVVGKSGSGKTTLLRIMSGLDKDYKGDIEYFDENGELFSPKIGVVFQEARLMPWLNVEENIKLFDKKNEIDVEKYLELVSLEGKEKMYPDELSGGMASRVSVARAIAYDPSILFMDEPFASLDYFTRNTLVDEIIKIHEKTKKGIVFITHNIDEAISLASNIIVFSKGEIINYRIEKSYPRNVEDIELIKLKKEILNKII